jgi:hypothetical protein
LLGQRRPSIRAVGPRPQGKLAAAYHPTPDTSG